MSKHFPFLGVKWLSTQRNRKMLLGPGRKRQRRESLCSLCPLSEGAVNAGPVLTRCSLVTRSLSAFLTNAQVPARINQFSFGSWVPWRFKADAFHLPFILSGGRNNPHKTCSEKRKKTYPSDDESCPQVETGFSARSCSITVLPAL